MGILSDSKILEKINSGEIVINPYDHSQLGSNSYDVRMSNKLLVYLDPILDPKEDQATTTIDIPKEGLVIHPGKLYLGVTIEHTETLKDVIMFEGKSSLARLGLFVHITSGFGDVGFKGHITLEISCIQPIRIYPNMKIGQVYYQSVDGFVINPYSSKIDAKYNNTNPLPMKSQMYKNFQQEEKEFKIKRVGDSGLSFTPDGEIEK